MRRMNRTDRLSFRTVFKTRCVVVEVRVASLRREGRGAAWFGAALWGVAVASWSRARAPSSMEVCCSNSLRSHLCNCSASVSFYPRPSICDRALT